MDKIKIKEYIIMNNLLALAQHLGLDVFQYAGAYYVGVTREEFDPELSFGLRLEDEIVESSNDSNILKYNGEEYLVVDNEEADILWEEELEHYINELILPELPEIYRDYFDSESWKYDARMDGRGHSLNRYDGMEYKESVNGEFFYIYRLN